ncbi:hypothetical protein ES707_12457 [subsurface metagenome]
MTWNRLCTERKRINVELLESARMSFRIPDWLGYEIRERWERLVEKLLAARGWLNRQNPKIIIGITVVCGLLLLTTVIVLLSGPEAPKVKEYKKGWFYDLNTGKLFVAKSKLIPPIEAPSGPLPDGSLAGVKAHVFTYVYEPNESERFIGFLETSDPNAEKDSSVSAKPKTDGAASWGRGKLFRRIEGEKWVSGSSREGRAILEEVLLPNENGERARSCRPK